MAGRGAHLNGRCAKWHPEADWPELLEHLDYDSAYIGIAIYQALTYNS